MMKQGEYSDREVITAMNKYCAAQIKAMNIHTFKVTGRRMQEQLKTSNLTAKQIRDLAEETIKNPPVEIKEVVAVPTPEELAQAQQVKLNEENATTSEVVDGKEVIRFSEKGMINLHREDNALFAPIGKDAMYDHEDDGRIFKIRTVKRLSDNKLFSYNFIWHHEWDDSFFDNKITEQ